MIKSKAFRVCVSGVCWNDGFDRPHRPNAARLPGTMKARAPRLASATVPTASLPPTGHCPSAPEFASKTSARGGVSSCASTTAGPSSVDASSICHAAPSASSAWTASASGLPDRARAAVRNMPTKRGQRPPACGAQEPPLREVYGTTRPALPHAETSADDGEERVRSARAATPGVSAAPPHVGRAAPGAPRRGRRGPRRSAAARLLPQVGQLRVLPDGRLAAFARRRASERVTFRARSTSQASALNSVLRPADSERRNDRGRLAALH